MNAQNLSYIIIWEHIIKGCAYHFIAKLAPSVRTVAPKIPSSSCYSPKCIDSQAAAIIIASVVSEAHASAECAVIIGEALRLNHATARLFAIVGGMRSDVRSSRKIPLQTHLFGALELRGLLCVRIIKIGCTYRFVAPY
jgi:hypothetical protein